MIEGGLDKIASHNAQTKRWWNWKNYDNAFSITRYLGLRLVVKMPFITRPNNCGLYIQFNASFILFKD